MTTDTPSGDRLRDRRLVITGGAVGIGRAAGIGAMAEGAQVFLLDPDAAILAQNCNELENLAATAPASM